MLRIIAGTVLLLACWVMKGQAQEKELLDWTAAVDLDNGVDEAWHVHPIDDTSYVLTGVSTSPDSGSTGKHAILMKIVAGNSGISNTTTFFGDSDPDHDYQGFELHPISGGDFIFVGRTNKNGYDQALVMKLDSDFDTVWTRTYGDSGHETDGYSIRPSPDGGYVLTGITRPTGHYDSTDVYLLKVDDTGGVVSGWPKTFDRDNDVDVGKRVRIYAEGSDTGYVVVGYSRENDGFNILVIKTDLDGSALSGWPKTYDDANGYGDFGEDVITIDSSGTSLGYVVCGAVGPPQSPTKAFQAFVMRLDSDGDTVWTRKIGSSAFRTYAQGVIRTGIDGDLYVGVTRSADSNYFLDQEIVAMNMSGDIRLQLTPFPRVGADYVFWIQPTPSDSGFVYCGAQYSTPDTASVTITKVSGALCGDVNNDGSFDVSDITYLTNYMYRQGPPPPRKELANTDGSCPADEITIHDLQLLSDYFYGQGQAPVCPWCQ